MAVPFFKGTTKGSKSFIRGEKEFLDNIERIARETGGKILEKTLLEASEPLRDEASDNAPYETGFLASSIGQQVLETTQKKTHVVIGPEEDAFYGLFQELGWKPNGPAQPFLRPAFDKQKRKIGKNMRHDLWEHIRRQVRSV